MRPSPPLRALFPAVAALVLLPLLARAPMVSAQHPGEKDALGPIRWLLLPSEERELRQAVTAEERDRLEERIWRRRNPLAESKDHEAEAENPNRERFLERVRAADLLYGEKEAGTPGSLTQRGRAHILLGPPSYLSQRYQKSPRWDPGLWQRQRAATRPLLVETWGYRPEDLTPELRAELAQRGWPFELQVRFIVRDGRTFILEGEPMLEAAARSFLRRTEP